MAGFVELFVRFVDEVGGDPVDGSAARVRERSVGKRPRDRVAAERRASEIERINWVLRWKEKG